MLTLAYPMTSLETTASTASSSRVTVSTPVGIAPIANRVSLPGTASHESRSSVFSSPEMFSSDAADPSAALRSVETYPLENASDPQRNGTATPTGTVT
jgi:hypothetical protein